MKTLDKTVELSGAAWNTMKKNIIEEAPREAIGDLTGKGWGKRYIIINAYAWKTAKTNPTWTSYGNESARKRSIDVDVAERGISRYSNIGHYHVQVEKEHEGRGYMGLGKGEDIELLRQVMKDYKFDKESIQIVGSVRINKNSKRKPGEKTTKYKRKLRITFSGKKAAYDVILAAYRLTQTSVEELKIKRRRVKVVAVKE
jgi:hypothetical protein